MIEKEQPHQFLMGLDDETYANVQCQVLALDALPSLDKIFNMIQQEENHKQLMQGREHDPESSMAFAVRDKSVGGEKNTCRHCGRYGHEETSCYEIIGYPSTWGTRGRGRGRRGARGGRIASGRGHGAGRETANVAVQLDATGPVRGTTAATAALEASQVVILGLSSEQV